MILSAAIYLAWWGAVELMLPGSFNPLPGRLAVSAYFFFILGLARVNPSLHRRLPTLFMAGLWLVTLHYFYLFYGNGGDQNWVVGSYITVLPIAFCFFTKRSLFAYSVFSIRLRSLGDFGGLDAAAANFGLYAGPLHDPCAGKRRDVVAF